MSETEENTKTEKTITSGILYNKVVDVIGNTDKVYIEEYVSDLLGITDKDGVTPIDLNKIKQEEEIPEKFKRNVLLETVYFPENDVKLSEPMTNGWIDFIFDGGIVDKTLKN